MEFLLSNAMVILTRAKAKVLRENLNNEEYCEMFKSLNFHSRRRGRRAALEAEEIANLLLQPDDETDADYNPDDEADDNIEPIPDIEPNPAIIIQPTVATRKFSFERVISVFQLTFYIVGIVLFAYIIYQKFAADDEMEVLVRRRRM